MINDWPDIEEFEDPIGTPENQDLCIQKYKEYLCSDYR